MKHYAITGGTGLIGQALSAYLTSQGATIKIFTRNPKNKNQFLWNPDLNQFNSEGLSEIDTLIHLAGTNVASGRWSGAFKEKIKSSRVEGLRFLYEQLKHNPNQVKTIISASATGIYQNGSSPMLHEDEAHGHGFLAETCQSWEAEAAKFQELGIRVVSVRIGIVFSEKGGFIPKVAQPIKWGLGAVLAKGTQRISWIHVKDVCKIIAFCAENDTIHGAINAVADHPITNKELTKAMAKALHKPLWLPAVPIFVLRILFGDFTEELIADKAISNNKIKSLGYSFSYNSPYQAVSELLN